MADAPESGGSELPRRSAAGRGRRRVVAAEDGTRREPRRRATGAGRPSRPLGEIGHGSDTTGATERPTRERILDVALDLFNELGYDKTSLREISGQLGLTKAALYYHFRSKQDILLALHLRLHELGQRVFREARPESVDAWPGLLDQFIDQVVGNQKLFTLHQRNRAALEHLDHDHHDAEHGDLEEQFHALMADPDVPLRQRARMACSLGAVIGGLMAVGDLFADDDPNELAELVREAVHDLLGSLRDEAADLAAPAGPATPLA